MNIALDHVIVAARELREGVEWLEARLGVPMGAGGKHPTMGTHNRLLSLGPGRFIEVLAVDPEAPAPARPRWFRLDEPQMRERLETGPALVHWVARTDDIRGAVAFAPGDEPEVLDLARGEFRWKIGVPRSGSTADGGTAPTFIQWESRHPADLLGDSGCRLERLALRHPGAPGYLARLRGAGLDARDPVQAHHDGHGLEALIRTPQGPVLLRE